MGVRPSTSRSRTKVSQRLTKPLRRMYVSGTKKSSQTTSFANLLRECSVCRDSQHPYYYPNEGHLSTHFDICRTCVRIYVDGKILQEGVFRVVCPTLGCQVELAHEEVRQIASQRAFARCDELLIKHIYESDPNFRYCTNAKCHTGQIIVDGGPPSTTENINGADAASFFKCASCGYKTCFNCSVPWHVGFTCSQYKAGLKERQNAEPKSQAWLAANAKLCDCGKWIQKISGCDHMACVCGRHWCYACGVSYKEINRVGNSAHKRTCPHYA